MEEMQFGPGARGSVLAGGCTSRMRAGPDRRPVRFAPILYPDAPHGFSMVAAPGADKARKSAAGGCLTVASARANVAAP